MKKVIGMLTLIIMILALVCTFSTNTYAADASYKLGVKETRKSGEAYCITSEKGNGHKIVWKIVSYSDGKTKYNNAFYCIKAGYGFSENSNIESVTDRKVDYVIFTTDDNTTGINNMKTNGGDVINSLNSINKKIYGNNEKNLNNAQYRQIMWIIDHMCLLNVEENKEKAKADKERLLKAAGIEDNVLNDNEIEVIQQLALWYYTNPDDEDYHKVDSEGNPILSEILIKGENGYSNSNTYGSLADYYGDPLINDGSELKYQEQAKKLYRYLITNADPKYNYEAPTTSPITLNKDNFKATQDGDRFIIGPLNITVDETRDSNITELVFKDQDAKVISLEKGNKEENELLNANKEVVESGDINEVIGQDFYISLPITTSIKNVSFSIKGNYGITTATYYTAKEKPEENQPVILVEKELEPYEGEAEVKLQKFDLALRKSITKINGVAPSVSRLPKVDVTELKSGVKTTAIYNHPKDALKVDTNDLIEYTLTVYNEGERDGYASVIKDYLPAGIEYVGLVGENADKYSVKAVKKADGTTTLTITNTGKTVLDKYEGRNELSHESVTIQCKVTANVIEQDQRFVNIAEITKYYDSESNTTLNVDRDSTVANFPSGKINNNYKGNGKVGNYYPGQEDDDDFELVIIPGRYFDLSLRKFITKVNGEALQTSRVPVVDLTKLISGESTTATYNAPKAPVLVKVGDIVTYTIRVYNEGQLDAYASEITDHLPELLEFLPENEDNIANGWVYDENDLTLRTIKTSHLSKEVDEENIIKAFDGTTLSYKDVEVKCKVKPEAISGDKITNIADITSFTDSNGNTVKDRDSEKDNVKLPTDEELPNYKDEEINRGDKYIPGQEDDDDFEKVKVQIFDLALRKFITAVDNEAISNRIPVPTMGTDGIKYNHTKDPVEVQTNDIVTYTLRVFNEGDISGYASEVTDDLPEGLLYLPENELNKTYRWKMIDKDGNETDDIKKAVKVTTDYLSKEQEKTEGSNLIKAFNKEASITSENPDYKDIKISFKVIEPSTSERIITNIAQISDDSDENGNPIEDIDSIPGNDDMKEDDIDLEHVKLVYFDLALRKFITKVDNLDVNNRYPVPTISEAGIKYTHTKEPVSVANGNIVTYTLRVYNEGKMAGYAAEVTDDLPKGLLYLPENELNKTYRWKMIDEDGNETDDVKKAVKVTTDYLSKEQEETEGSNLIKAFNKTLGIKDNNPDYKDVKIAFKVTEPNTSDRIIINTAEISEDTNKDGKPVDDIDSTPGNNKEGEDDIDIEKIKVKYFDLALKKWVTQSIVIENGKETVTNTGHTGDENPEPVVKVDLKDKKLNKVTVKFKYKIKVTNEGEIEGYVKELKDYIPEGLKFVAEDNPDWKVEEDNVVSTTKLENTLLKPGQSATVDIVLTWINSDKNLGLKVNVAEISKDYNEYDDTPDIDSTPDNKKPGEDDIDEAPVILSIKTGDIQIYFTLTTIVLVTLAGGIYLIKKYVL